MAGGGERGRGGVRSGEKGTCQRWPSSPPPVGGGGGGNHHGR